MDADTILKAVLIVSISFAIVIISIQVARVLQEALLTLREFRRTVKDINNVAEKVGRDYENVTSFFYNGFGKFRYIKNVADLGLIIEGFKTVRKLTKRYR